MSSRKINGIPVDVIDRNVDFIQESFDLDRLDAFVTGLGVEFCHYKAMPSPIGKNDRGDYRRNDGVDTISSNGMLYSMAGKFTATMTDNSRSGKRGDAGFLDPSESRLVMPRFYNENNGVANGNRIYLAPGDRIYVADPEADVLVANYQEMDYEDGIDNIPMFPIVQMEADIVDSRNIYYRKDADFIITRDGNIKWLHSGNNPGIDPETGKGRIYSIRYLYKAYWYITALPKEVRVTNVTEGEERGPSRMPYFAVVTREFMFHNQNRGSSQNELKPKPTEEKRADSAPRESITPSEYAIQVEMSAFDDTSEDEE